MRCTHSQNSGHAAWNAFLPPMPEALTALLESLLVVEIHTEQAILLAQRDGGPLLIQRPLDSNYLWVTASYVCNVSKCYIRRNLLLDGKSRLGVAVHAGKLGVDLNFADSKKTLQAAGHRAREGLADQSRRPQLIPILRCSRRARG